MSVSAHIQTPEILQNIKSYSPSMLKQIVGERTRDYYEHYQSERDILVHNMQTFHLDSSPAAVERVIEGIGYHYYEKLLPLCIEIKQFKDYLSERIEARSAVDTIQTL